MTEKKSNHQANIVRIAEVSKHGNADSLEIIKIGGYQAISRLGTFKVGDLAVYIQPDSVVPQTEPFRFIWEPYQTDPDGAVPEKRRRITAKKLRGEWSEGLLMPLTDFPELDFDPEAVAGVDVSDKLGITHYDPDLSVESTKGDSISGPRRRYPRSLKGWFFFLLHKIGFKSAGRQLHEEVGFHLPVYDVEAYKNHTLKLVENEQIVITEKIHGSNARFVFMDERMYAGSRTLWKAPKSNCIWRKALALNPQIETWCRENEGFALYGEVVPTQKGFNYGCKPGEVKFFIFDIHAPDDDWLDYDEALQMLQGYGDLKIVPRLYYGSNTPGTIQSFVDGPSQVFGATHLREGIVVRPRVGRRVPGLGRVILKIVSNSFLEKDSKAI